MTPQVDAPAAGSPARAAATGVPSRHHEALYRALVAELEARWPGVRVLPKRESGFCRLVDRALRVITFGKQDRFLSSFVTTFGRRVYVPDGWERLDAGTRYCILRHEAIHIGQFRRLTWPGITLIYLLLPLPFVFAGGRAWLEWQGYRETLVAHWQLYGRDAARSRRLADEIVRRFTGPDYAWMWVRGRTIEGAIARQLARMDASPPPPLAVPDEAAP